MGCDRIFLEKGCPACAVVLTALCMGDVIQDLVVGSDGNRLLVFGALSPMASADLLEKYGCEGKKSPVLVKESGEEVSDLAEILRHCEGMKKA